MCKINCSGGCTECAPEEHAFYKWLESATLLDSTMADPDEKAHHIALQAFSAGYWSKESS